MAEYFGYSQKALHPPGKHSKFALKKAEFGRSPGACKSLMGCHIRGLPINRLSRDAIPRAACRNSRRR
jgi:hypothetical protein